MFMLTSVSSAVSRVGVVARLPSALRVGVAQRGFCPSVIWVGMSVTALRIQRFLPLMELAAPQGVFEFRGI